MIALLLGLLSSASVAAASRALAECCDDCPCTATRYLGTSKHILPDAPCPEGSVATVEALRAAATEGKFEVLTWNKGGSTYTDSFFSPYKYLAGTTDEKIQCFEASDLPIVGDQTTIKVTLNCESVRCKFRYDIRFGCVKTGTTTADRGGLQVLSDVDDTIVCPNPGCEKMSQCRSKADARHFLAGKDRRLESEEFYPGVAELMLGLARGPRAGSGDKEDVPYVPAKPMLLSARARELEVFVGIDQDSPINAYIEATGSAHSQPSWGVDVDGSMYGTLTDGTSFTEFGQTKARSYVSLSEERGTTRFGFLGDNGQGDVCAAQSMLEAADGKGERMEAVLIHLTQDPAKALTACQHPDGEDFTLDLPEGDRVHYYSVHSDAALWAWERGFISACAARAVYEAVETWRRCRCPGVEGECEKEGELRTGVTDVATRNETLAYCEDVEVAQSALANATDGILSGDSSENACGDIATLENNNETLGNASDLATNATCSSNGSSRTGTLLAFSGRRLVSVILAAIVGLIFMS